LIVFFKPGQQRRDIDSGLAQDVKRSEPDRRGCHVNGDEDVPVVAGQLLVLGYDAHLLRLPVLKPKKSESPNVPRVF